MTAEEVSDGLARLRRSQAALAEMPIDSILDRLDALAERLVGKPDPSAPPRSREVPLPLEIDLLKDRIAERGAAPTPVPTVADLAPPEMRQGLRVLGEGMRRPALEAWLTDELGDRYLLDAFRPRPTGGMARATGRGPIALFLAANIPLLAWPVLVAALLAKAAVFVRRSQRDEAAGLTLFRETLRAVAPELAACIDDASWPREDEEASRALCREAASVIVYGSDEALADIRALTPVGTTFLGYGHGASIALVDSSHLDDATASVLADDILAYGQLGCLSPQMVYALGSEEAADSFAAHLAERMARRRSLAEHVAQLSSWAPPPAAAVARLRRERDLALFEPGVRIHGEPASGLAIFTPDPAFVPSCGFGLVRVAPLPELAALEDALRPLPFSQRQGIVLSARLWREAETLHRLGFSRIALIGQAQAPPLWWRNEGRGLLASLVRWTDLDR